MDRTIEEKIIGCLLINDNLIRELYLQPKHFFDQNCKIALNKILEVYSKRGNVDIVMIVEEFDGDEYMQTFCMACMDGVVSPTSFSFFQERQEEIYKTSKIKDAIQDYDEKKFDYDELIEEIKKINDDCTSPTNSTATMLSGEEIFDLITTERSLLEFKRFKFLQNGLGLLQNTVNVIAARTSQGKSAFALNLMNDLSQTYKCLYFNMEMTEKEIYQRLVSINSQVPINDFPKYENSRDISSRMFRGIEEIHKRNIKIYQGGKNVKGLRTILSKESRKEHCIAFIDYVGYVSSNKFNQNDRERIGEVVREIQLMSKELNITVFLIAQINREGNDAPSLVNLKDSGELEQTAHCVMMIHNPNKDDISNQEPIIELHIPKNRSGQLFKLQLCFKKPTQTFLALSNREQ